MKSRIRIETSKERINSLQDFEKLPEGEWVEGADLEIELVEEVDAKLLIPE